MKHKALIVGAGRIGAGFNWEDKAYTHAGAYAALKDRVELVGFVEPDKERAEADYKKWGVPAFADLDDGLEDTQANIVSICTQPQDQANVFKMLDVVDAIYCEKPYMGGMVYRKPLQINFLRRGDPFHRKIANLIDVRCSAPDNYLFFTGKDDIHTRCHVEDLAEWWKCKIEYHRFDGPCSYFFRFRIATGQYKEVFFSLGGVDGGLCMKNMLANLLDHLDNGTPLFSPARQA